MAIDGTERRRQRPTNAAQQQEQDSGKKKTHTDKNLLLVNEHTDKAIYLDPPWPAKSTTKKRPMRGRCFPDQCHARQGHGLSGV